ncbi:MAG: hypothetical protein J5769_01510 [Bacteroidales bacterium]|nr:hypothetical protein [Bacteroidales bacterium]
MKLLTLILVALLQGMPFLNQLQKRDSILIADQLEYGVTIDQASDTVMIGWPQIPSPELMTDIYTIGGWKIDTLNMQKGQIRNYSLKGSFVIQPFADGVFELPPISVLRLHRDGSVDTLTFRSMPMEVTTIQIDTTTFVPHDIRPQITYPVTFAEVFPWVIGFIGAVLLVAIVVCLILIGGGRRVIGPVYKEPAHITALRKMDKFRSNKYWVPEKQKQFYSGITDALREYIAARYGVGALEMTSAEIFDGLKGSDIPPGLYGELKELFERADFVKFAKYVATDEENATVLPLGVRFVTETYIPEEEEISPRGPEDLGRNDK